MGEMVVALYDFRSKQNYIYHTNKIKEISGASALIANMYGLFIEACDNEGLKIKNDYDEGKKVYTGAFSIEKFKNNNQYQGEVIYVGGGNLYVIYKDKDAYIKANKIFSKLVIEKSYTLQLLASCTNFTGNFNNDRAELYKINNIKKNTEYVYAPCTVLPFTQVDQVIYEPIVAKNNGVSITKESLLKLNAYDYYCKNTDGETDLSEIGKNEGKNSLLAIIYTDGNGIGSKLKDVTKNLTDYDSCVKALREFSEKIQNIYVTNPLNKIKERLSDKNVFQNNPSFKKFRCVVGGGDEIAIICNAHAAYEIATTYFKALNENTDDYRAGMGIAICHSGDPYSEVYKIAESCCESAKKKSRECNCIDWHFCHGAITNDLDVIRERQDAKFTGRPYVLNGNGELLIAVNPILSSLNRTDIKGLRDSIVKGASYYAVELERLKAKYKSNKELMNIPSYAEESSETYDEYCKNKQQIFDIAGIYDLWFAKTTEDEK